MANIVQRPWQKTEVPIALYGKQGCGKGIIFEWFRRDVLGPDHSFQTADPERDLFSKHSDGFINRVFVLVDEVKSLHDHSDKLKNAVTSSTLTWEPKNRSILTVENFCNLLFTTNNENALNVATDDRRLTLFRCDPKYVGDQQYFQNLYNHLKRLGVSAWFYKILMKRDLSKYPHNFQASRPITEYYRESQKVAIPAEKRYLSALVNGQGAEEWGASELYNHFRKWAEFEGNKHIKSHVSFARDLKRIDGVNTRKSCGVMKYRMTMQDIKRCLQQSGEYDENSYLHDSVI